jgi:glycosyltransferase involved in cell wall biosynthesis
MSLSVVIITRNEEANIGRCLESVKWADEIVVVDSDSTDRTQVIATEHGARVHTLRWQGFGHAKQTGVDLATGEWILSVDADEVVSIELADEIGRIVAGGTPCAGFYMPRKTNFLGRWILHCGWYPDPLLRLFRRSQGRFDTAVVHERVILSGEAGRLHGHLLHYSDPDLEHYLNKFNLYTTLGAREAYESGRRAGWFDVVVRPPVSFVKHYVSKQGFRDGMEGFVLSVLSAVAVLVKYVKLRDIERKEVRGKNHYEQT